MKVCSICKIDKDLSEFYKTPSKRGGKPRSFCKSCYITKYPHKTTEKSKFDWQKYKKSLKGTVTCLLNNAKDRAKRKDLPYELDNIWLIEKLNVGKCELSGINFDYEVAKTYRANPFSPSIDKIIPEKGYTKENSRVICFCVNMARSDWGDEILFKMANELTKNKPII